MPVVMPNLNYHIDYDRGQTLRVMASIRAIGLGLEEEMHKILEDAAREGERVAKSGVPKGRSGELEQAITVIHGNAFHAGGGYRDPGGAWRPGGGEYQATLKASGSIAPHLRWIWSGSGIHHIPQPHRAFNARWPNRAMEFDTRRGHFFRYRVKGQLPQREWWLAAEQTVETVVATRVASMNLGLFGR
jgi:hypothetical protein